MRHFYYPLVMLLVGGILLSPAWADSKLPTYTNSLGMKFVLIPAGSFMMGSARKGRVDSPAHRVEISRPFYLQTAEVTQAQWKAVMGTEPWLRYKHAKPFCPTCAATHIAWDEAHEFIRKLNKREGGEMYRLPTEAEWEYACRAGSNLGSGYGDSGGQLGDYAWYADNALDRGDKYAHAVGRKQPNQWGLYDMLGNVMEWCQDWFGQNYYATSPVRDPEGPPEGNARVLRGASWSDGAWYQHCGYRGSSMPGIWNSGVGFRLARNQDGAKHKQ